MTTSGETGAEWQGFVVPYRYYGPGYAGLGYYAVYYQGGAAQRDEEDRSQEFDQRHVRYGQGQGAGAAWQSSRSQGGQTQRYGGEPHDQSDQWQTQGGQGASQGGQWGNQSGRGYAGRGPKGYRRSDDRIREEISDQFMENDQLDASDIEITVAAGVVTLTGTVEDRQSKRLAEDIAERGNGVRDVMNQLTVDNEASTRRNSGDKTGGSAGDGSRSSGSRTSSGARSSTGSGSTTRSRSQGSTTNRNPSRTAGQSRTGSGTGQPVGAGTGGATDGGSGNGSNRDR